MINKTNVLYTFVCFFGCVKYTFIYILPINKYNTLLYRIHTLKTACNSLLPQIVRENRSIGCSHVQNIFIGIRKPDTNDRILGVGQFASSR